MAKFWIHYSHALLIEADNAEEAKEIFCDRPYEAIGETEIQIDEVEEEIY